MSSIYKNKGQYSGASCIDGKLDWEICLSQKEVAPWLALDFGAKVDIKNVTVYNLKNPWAKRFQNAEVRVTDELPTSGEEMFTGGQLLGTFEGPATSGQIVQIEGQVCDSP